MYIFSYRLQMPVRCIHLRCNDKFGVGVSLEAPCCFLGLRVRAGFGKALEVGRDLRWDILQLVLAQPVFIAREYHAAALWPKGAEESEYQGGMGNVTHLEGLLVTVLCEVEFPDQVQVVIIADNTLQMRLSAVGNASDDLVGKILDCC